MEGTNFYRASLIAGEFLRNPRDSYKWFIDKVTHLSPMEQRLPWMTYGAIDYLNGIIAPGQSVFEWGIGGSTLFLLDLGARVVSVESDPVWLAACQGRLELGVASQRWESRLIEASGSSKQAVDRYVNSVLTGGPWDIVVVDGLEEAFVSRVECIEVARETIKPGGILVLDDSYRERYRTIPDVLLRKWERIPFRGFGPSRIGVSQTDIYRKPVVE